MRQNQEDFLSMTKKVRSLMNSNLAKITPIPAITDTSDQIQLQIDQIATMYLRQQKKIIRSHNWQTERTKQTHKIRTPNRRNNQSLRHSNRQQPNEKGLSFR